MAFDPSIISQIPDFGPHPAEAMAKGFQLKDLVNTEQLNQLRLNQVKTEQSEQLQMKEILSKEDLSTPQGITKAAQALTKAGLAQQGMKLMGTAQQYQTGAIENEQKQLQVAAQKQDQVALALDNVYGQLQKLEAAGATPEMLDLAAAQLAKPAIQRLRNGIPEMGQYLDKFVADPKNLTFAGIKQAEDASNKVQALMKERLAERAQTTKEKHEETYEKDIASRISDRGAGAVSLSPEAQALKDDLAARDPSFMAARSGAKSIQQQNRILEDWARQGRTADDIIGSRQETKGVTAEVSTLYKQKANLERTDKSIVAPGGFLDQAEAAVKEVDLNKVKALGKLSNWSLENITDPALQNYHSRITELRAEYAIVISKGGQLTNEARSEAERVVPDYMTPASFARVKQVITQGIGASTRGVDESIDKALKKTPKDAGPKKITSDEDYNALPSGTEFIAPDGSHRKKP